MSAELPRQSNSPDLDPSASPQGHYSVPEASAEDLQEACPTDEELAEWESLGRFLGRAMSVTVAGLPAMEGRTIGRFRVLRVLGRGGNATVYHALDPLIGREVAIKVPHPFVIPLEDSRGRFLQEAKLLSELVHANIVAIFDVGHDREWPFLVFEYCAGGSLADWLARQEQHLSPATCAQIVRTLALAAHFAHAKGILHRDVNPRNVLLVPLPAGEAASDGVAFPYLAKLSDFGLGTWLDEQKSAVQTQSDTVMGTLPYMAPEQTKGGNLPLQPTTDVYAFGVMLFELLTSTRPFVGETHVETIQLIRNQEAPRLRQIRQSVPRDLETICLHCLEKVTEQRYRTAAELAEDLERFLLGNPIRARRINVIERTARWVSKRRTQVGIVAVILVLLATIGAGSAWYADKLDDARLAERQLKQKADDQNSRLLLAQANDQRMKSALRSSYDNQMEAIAERIKRPGYPAYELVQQLREWIPQSSSDPDYRGFEWYYLVQACGGDVATMVKLSPENGEVLAMHVSEAGDSIFVACDNVLSEWDVKTGQQRRTVLTASRDIRDFAISERQGQIAVARFGHPNVEFRDLTSGAIRSTAICPFKWLPQCNRVFFDTDQYQLRAVYSRDRFFKPLSRVIAHAVGSAPPIGSGHSHDGYYYDIVIDPQTQDLISTANEGVHVAIHGKDLQPVIPLTAEGSVMTSLAISSDGRLLAVGTDRNDILMCRKDATGAWRQVESLNVMSREQPVERHNYLHPRNRLRFGRDNRTLYMSHGSELHVWDVAQRKILHSMTGFPGRLRYLELLPDGQTAVWTTETVVGLWQPPIALPPIAGHDKEAWSVGFSPDGKVLATGSDDETVRLWNVVTGKRLAELPGHIATVTQVAYSPLGKLIASASLDETVRVWDADTLKLTRIVNGQSGRVDAMAWFADGRRLAVTDSAKPTFDQRVLVWDTQTGTRVNCLEGCLDRIRSVIVTADQGHVIAGSNDKTIRIWNVESGELEQSWKMTSKIGCLALLNQDRWLASGGDNSVLQIHNLSDGTLLRELPGHTAAVRCLALSLDGRVLASGGADNSILLWDVKTARRLLEWTELPEQVNGLAFSPSGEILTAALHDGSIKYIHAPRFTPFRFDR